MTSHQETTASLVDEFHTLVREDMKLAELAVSDRDAQRSFLLKRKKEYMQGRRQEWLRQNETLLQNHLRSESPADPAEMKLRLQICDNRQRHDLWRAAKLKFWSMPPNEYVGRRKRILIFDRGKLMGIAAVASCLWGLGDRDNWIGWSVKNKYNRINHVLDAYVLGAVPPYNGDFRGSKLVAMLLASDWLYSYWKGHYGDAPALVFTTTLFGYSAVLHHTCVLDRNLWIHVGKTKGMGTMHLSKETMLVAKELLCASGVEVENRFGDGPNWKLRLVRTALEKAGLEPSDKMNHGFHRWIYGVELGKNVRPFLREETDGFEPYDDTLDDMFEAWLVAQHDDIS